MTPPRHHGDPAREYAAATREGAALFDRSSRARILLEGRGPARMLHGIVTGRIPAWSDGGEETPVGSTGTGVAAPATAVSAPPTATPWPATEAPESLVLTPKGRIVTDLRLVRLGPGEEAPFLLELPAAGKAPLLEHFGRYLPPRFARPTDLSQRSAQVAVVGPEAARVLARALEALGAAGAPETGGSHPGSPVPGTPDSGAPNPGAPNPDTPSPGIPGLSAPNPGAPGSADPGAPDSGGSHPGLPGPDAPNPGTPDPATLAPGEARVLGLPTSDEVQAPWLVLVRSRALHPPTFELLGTPAIVHRLRVLLEGEGVLPAGDSVWQTLRIERGTPETGQELGEEVLPPEAGLERRAIDHQKGCYTGQEVIVRIRDRGRVNRHLRGLLLGEAPAPSRGTALFPPRPATGESGDVPPPRPMGEVLSTAQSPLLGGGVALAWVRREVAPGEEVRVGDPQGPPARVVALGDEGWEVDPDEGGR